MPRSVLSLRAGGKPVERLVLAPGAAPDGGEEDRARRAQEQPRPHDDQHDHASRVTPAPGRRMAAAWRSADDPTTGRTGLPRQGCGEEHENAPQRRGAFVAPPRSPQGRRMTWVLIVGLVWLAVGLLLGIPLALAIRHAEEDEGALTQWGPSDPPARTAARREPPPGQPELPRRPRAGRPQRQDGEPGPPS
jgi:hypothetical protein